MTAGGNIDAATFDSFHSRAIGARQGVYAKIDLFVRALRQHDETDKASQTVVFLSHAAADAPIGMLLKGEIQGRLPGITVFCSSDPTDLPLGRNGRLKFSRLSKALECYFLFFSPEITEAMGFVRVWTIWFRKRKIIPLCLGEVRKGALPTPLSELQGVNADDAADLVTVLELIASESGVTLADAKNLMS
jgi:hypothetical protein